jgi:SAM-dependent methyltransferase
VRYVDRWTPEENRELFPELGPAEFPAPDVVCNFDEDLLRVFDDESQDFVVCSHVLEHLANPLGFLSDMYRVLRPGGVALVLLPDRHRTFDHSRQPTPLAHVVSDYEAGSGEVDAGHIEDFLVNTDATTAQMWAEASPEGREALLTLHRQRSIHVHCWDEPEFSAVLRFAVEHLGQQWDLVDGTLTDESGPAGMEFGYLLRKSAAVIPVSGALQRFSSDLARWRAKVAGRQPGTGPEPNPGAADQADLIQKKDEEIARLTAELAAVYASKVFRYSAPVRRVYAWLRRHRRGP